MGSIFEGLKLLDTYAYYDTPVLFTARDAIGSVELIVLIDDNEEGETWLSVGVSEARLQAIQAGEIDFHDAFKQAESGIGVKTTFYHAPNRGFRVQRIETGLLTQDDLPMPGERATK